MDAGLRLTSAAFAYGEIVWVRRPDAGVKFEGRQRGPRAMVSRKAGSPGRSRISRKAIAQGRPEASAKPVCSWAAYLVANSLRDRGCGAHPVFPAPSVFEGQRNAKLRAHRAARTWTRIESSSRPCAGTHTL